MWIIDFVCTGCVSKRTPYCPVIGSENKGVVLLFALQTKLCWSNLYLDGPVYIVIPIVQKYYVWGGGSCVFHFYFISQTESELNMMYIALQVHPKKFTVVSHHRIREKWQMNSSLAGKPHFHFQPCFVCHYDSTLFVSIMQRVLWTSVSYVKRQLRERICNISLSASGEKVASQGWHRVDRRLDERIKSCQVCEELEKKKDKIKLESR